MTPEQQIALLEEKLAECQAECARLKSRNEMLVMLVGELKKFIREFRDEREKP